MATVSNAQRSDVEASASPELIDLQIEHLAESVALEKAAHRSPWSEELIRNEFFKDISLRPALILGDKLIAQSYNHLILDELHILNIAVTPSHRRLGYANLLLDHLLQLGKETGAKLATLEVRESNIAAKQLYLRFNFTVIGMRPNYYRDNNENALVLQLTLAS